MLELQKFIFEEKHSRLDLLNYIPKSQNEFNVLVYRNHSFELIENTIKVYLDFAGINVNFIYSDYDDSLSFLNINDESDLLILWLDLSRYSMENIESFLKERISYLSEIYKKNILFIPYNSNNKINQELKSESISFYDLSFLEELLGEEYENERLEKFTGTKLSHKSLLLISKELGLNYIPSLLLPNLKVIAVDLDNTLYKGVLGEDGVQGIILTESHRQLQERLSELSSKGFLVCVVTKNQESDVLELFSERDDFPLKAQQITKIFASWDTKSSMIKSMLSYLNVGSDSLLFIDDNIGEVCSVLKDFPDIKYILASDDAALTLNILNNYPGLLKLNVKKEDAVRKHDIQANEKRKNFQAKMSEDDYIKALDVNLSYKINKNVDIERFSELANKTNQFIFNYKRYTFLELKNYLSKAQMLIISVSLKDKLSDSGTIAGFVFENKQDYLQMEECFVSCRALGRGLDDEIVLYSIKIAMEFFNQKKLQISFQNGDRNLPAQNFINQKLKAHLNEPAIFKNILANEFIQQNIEENQNEG